VKQELSNDMADDTAVFEEPRVESPDVGAEVSSPAEPPYVPAPKRPVWKKPAFLVGLVGGLLLLGAIALFTWLHYRNRVSTDDAQIDGHIVPIASKIYGTVQEVLVNDNQPVKAGDVLVRIDPRDYQAKVDQEQAALAYSQSQARAAGAGVPLTTQTTTSGTSEAEAALNASQASAREAQLDAQRSSTALVAAAHAEVQQAQANYDKAQADLARMRPLVEKEEISKQQFDTYVAAARVADGQLRASQENLASAQQTAGQRQAAASAAQARVLQARAAVESSRANQGQVQITRAQAESARANVQQARANLETAQLQLSYAGITAPVNGVVTKKTVEVGQIVQQGQGLLTLVPLQDVWVTANFKETQLRDVRIGQKAEINVDVSGRSYEAHVDSIAGATGARMSLLPPENATGNFVKVVQRIPVKLVFDNLPKDAFLAPGMNVDAIIFTK
jgi:membrane fusion protein (multidrug efflux system)